MRTIIHGKLKQGSQEWFDIRKDKATASQFSKILTPTGKPSASAKGYMRKLARECVCSDPMEFDGNKFTEWGNLHEYFARELFKESMLIDVEEVGFVSRNDLPHIGCSPDGLIINDQFDYVAGLEIKCPQVDTHVDYLMAGELPAAYKLQVHGSMAVTGLDKWWFMSYFPNLNPLIILVERDEFTQLVESAIVEFNDEYAKERQLVIDAITIL